MLQFQFLPQFPVLVAALNRYICAYSHTFLWGSIPEKQLASEYLQLLNTYLSSLLRWASLTAFLVRMKLKRKIRHMNITPAASQTLAWNDSKRDWERTGINIYSPWRKQIWQLAHLTLMEISKGWSMFLHSFRKSYKSTRRKKAGNCLPHGDWKRLAALRSWKLLSLEHAHKHVQFSRSGELSLPDT